MTTNEKIKAVLANEVDNYEMTLFGMIGFLNLFRFNDATQSMDSKVKIWHGRKMRASESNKVTAGNDVTPDLVIQFTHDQGLVAEVKYSFPKDQEHWMDDFRQLMSYDDDLTNWETDTHKISRHEIVLLPEQGRTVAIKEFFERMVKEGKVSFDRNFAIVEFNRSDQGHSYLFFRTHLGDIKSSDETNRRLHQGIKVPIEKLLMTYEKYKLCDSKPPIPHMLMLIWEGVLLERAAAEPKFSFLRKNAKIPIEISVDEIRKELSQNYSLSQLDAGSSFQPEVPQISWLREAIDILVRADVAEWMDSGKAKVRIKFQKHDDLLDYFIDIYAAHREPSDEETGQGNLFSERK